MRSLTASTSSTSPNPCAASLASTPVTSSSGTEAPLVTPTVDAPSSQPSSISALNNYDYFPGQPRFFGVTLRLKY